MSREAFVMAATVGLAARNVAHDPEKFGRAAVDLGLAVAAQFEARARGEAPPDRADAHPALTEADAHLGLANRLAAPFAKRLFLAYAIPGRNSAKVL